MVDGGGIPNAGGMKLGWEDFRRLLAGERLPAAVVDLDALGRNVDRIRGRLDGTGKTLRVASKSVRHVGLLRRVLERGGEGFRGLMCFSAEEAAFLVEEGFDDLFVAYPTLQHIALLPLARAAARGATVRLVADCREHLEAMGSAGREAGAVLDAVLELDVSYRPLGGRLHLGARRSPLRSPEDVVALARAAARIEGVRIAGLMGYEAHVAGVPDQNPFSPAMNPLRKALKRLAVPAVSRLRSRTVAALAAEGVELHLVNGGGTGSVSSTAAESCITEVTAGSGFLCSHLFDYFQGQDLEPAAFFALEICRVSDPGHVTCAGGGYVASGEPGLDRLPLPWLPRGLAYVPMEGAGEVQTPLRLGPASPPLAAGDPVVFRHAKAGELAERFDEYLLVGGGRILAREPTYRGQGRCFL